MIHGVINIYKEKGYTSHDVVAKLRGSLHQKKIGHTGTLDPDAEGVLPVCLGGGTRLCDMLTDKDKTYRAVMLLGKETDAWVEPPFYCCYGTNITIGEGSYLNFNCNFVDDGKIVIGKKVMFGPAVTIATVGHPVNPRMREYMYTDPVIIEDNCWIGAGVTICPGYISEKTV